MKKLLYLASFVGMLFASCSNDELVPEMTKPGEGEMVTNYISINVVPASTTRADDNNQGTNGLYRDGTESENKVNSVRFFFFDSTGKATPVKVTSSTEGGATEYASFLDWYPAQSGGLGDNDETVEKKYVATLGIFVPENGEKPASVVAVINPSDAVEAASGAKVGNVTGPSLAELEGCVANYEKGLVSENFVMSNSAYVSTTGKELATSLVKADGSYFKSSVEAALADPITIYVERVVARLDLWNDLATTDAKTITKEGEGTFTIYPLKIVDAATNATVEDVTINGKAQKVYIRFLGWNVTSTATNSNLLKNINPAWTSNDLFAKTGGTAATAWNNPTFHRSFWAMNPNNLTFGYGDFNGKSTAADNLYPATLTMPADNQNPAITYLQENASPYDEDGAAAAPTSPTKVILACQLVDETGTPIRLAEWGFQKFTIDALKSYLLGTICKEKFYVKKTTTENGETTTSYTRLVEDNFKFITAKEKFGATLPKGVNNYYSYLVLDYTLETGETLTKGEGDAAQDVDAAYINKYLLDTVNYSMIWEQGYSYYFFDVRHLGAEESVGYNGIVRNHIYDTHVKSIVGIGTPVLNPEETIYPEKPEYEESIVAAEIRILQWRVVSSDYDIKW